MKERFIIVILFLSFTLLAATAVFSATNPTGQSNPFGKTDTGTSFMDADKAKQSQEKRQQWFQKYSDILRKSRVSSQSFGKSLSNVATRLKHELEQQRMRTRTLYTDMQKQMDETAQQIAAYSGIMIKDKDIDTYTYWFNGRAVAVLNEEIIDDFGNKGYRFTIGIEYTSDTQTAAIGSPETNSQPTQSISFDYDSVGALYYSNLYGGQYKSNLADYLSAYSLKEKTVSASNYTYQPIKDTDDALDVWKMFSGKDEPSDTVIDPDSIYGRVEAENTLTTITDFSNVKYHTATSATDTTTGGIYGYRTSYDYNTTINAEEGAPETGSVTGVTYYKLKQKHVTPLENKVGEYWTHVADASTRFQDYGYRGKEAYSETTTTRLGITTRTTFYDARLDLDTNSYTGYREKVETKHKNSSAYTETERYDYNNITYDSYGRRTSYTVNFNIRGLSGTMDYTGISYDILGRRTRYSVKEDIGGTITRYEYYDYKFNNLWQATEYHVKINGIDHYRTGITYNNLGLLTYMKDVSTENGVTTSKDIYYYYNENGLLDHYIEKAWNTNNESYYTWIGNITYGSTWERIRWDEVIIKDTETTAAIDHISIIKTILDALTYDGSSYNYTGLDSVMDANRTIYTYLWRNVSNFPVGTTSGGYSFVSDDYRARFKTYNQLKRTTTMNADGTVSDTFEEIPE